MGDSRQEGSPLTGSGHDLSPPLGVVETMGVAPEGAQLIASGLSTEVAEIILQSRAPSIRKLYALKLRLQFKPRRGLTLQSCGADLRCYCSSSTSLGCSWDVQYLLEIQKNKSTG